MWWMFTKWMILIELYPASFIGSVWSRSCVLARNANTIIQVRFVDTPERPRGRTRRSRREAKSLILSWCELVWFTSSGTNFTRDSSANRGKKLIFVFGGSERSLSIAGSFAHISIYVFAVESPANMQREREELAREVYHFRFRFSPHMRLPAPLWYLTVIIINSLFCLASCRKSGCRCMKENYANNDIIFFSG